MLQNHIKIAVRFFARNKLFTIINISGLTIGITAFLLLTQYVSFEKSYDQGLDDVYRVTLTSNYGTDNFGTSAANHPAVGPAMKAAFPEVEQFARLMNTKIMNVRGVLSFKNEGGQPILSNLKDYNIYFPDGSLFDIFHIPLLQGNMETALKNPGSMVISSSMAERFFGKENPAHTGPSWVGKGLTINSDDEITVTGVFQDLPENTHLKFGLICLLFSCLAIFIAALGLFGIGSHMALEKVKEISVRKVMGASTLQALMLIPKKLLGLVLVAGVIAIPVVYFLAKNWLEGYAFKMEISAWQFLIPLLLVLLVAMASILAQSLKSALINPAVSLRND